MASTVFKIFQTVKNVNFTRLQTKTEIQKNIFRLSFKPDIFRSNTYMG